MNHLRLIAYIIEMSHAVKIVLVHVCIKLITNCTLFFSSPELKAQVSSFYPLLSVCLSVNFSHFHLLLQNN